MIAVICPSVFEYRSLLRARLNPKQCKIFLSGMGKVRTLYACHEIFRTCGDLQGILLLGFAGSLSPSLKIGDRIEPSIFIEQDYNAEPFEKFPNKILKKSSQILPGSKDAAILTQDRFLTANPYLNTPYAKKYPRLACDMESYALAYFCRRSKIRYGVIKLISDTADENADHDFLKACKKLSPALQKTARDAAHLFSHR